MSADLPNRKPGSAAEARALVEAMGAPHPLLRHIELVAEAGAILLDTLTEQGVRVDRTFVEIGIVLHDVGKIVHPEELTGPGSSHEPDGESSLLARGVSADLARVCLSHARFQQMSCSFEELVIALADKLWKGVRRPDLEGRVVDEAAARLAVNRWKLFVPLDSCFERIATGGDDRLQRSLR